MKTLLDILTRYPGRWLTMESLQVTLQVPPESILREVEQLVQHQGYQVEVSPMYGFRLTGDAARLDADFLEEELATARVGRKIVVYDETDSSNDVAWAHADVEGFDGLAVFTEQQRKGRGRLGRNWFSRPRSSILCSVLLQNEKPDSGPQLSLLTGLAVVEAVKASAGVDVRIKWPNDIMYDDRKLAGIMIESRPADESGYVNYVIGIGINCRQGQDEFPKELIDTAVSLKMITDAPVDRLSLARELLQTLDRRLYEVGQGRLQSLHDNWLRHCGVVGKRLTLLCDGHRFTGRVVDISVQEGLLMRLDSGMIRVFDPARTTVAVDFYTRSD